MESYINYSTAILYVLTHEYSIGGVIAIVYCMEEFNGGLIWPRTLSNSQASLACSNAGTHFEIHSTTRYCDLTGNWNNLDLSTCTLVEKSVTFLLV